MAKEKPSILLYLLVLWPLAAYAQQNDGLDFAAGQKLLLFDSFTDMPKGATPPHCKVQGGAVRLEDGRLMVDGGSSTRLTPNIATWPFENGDAWVRHATLTLHANGQCSAFIEIADPGDNQLLYLA